MLSISPRTVEANRANLLRKLGFHSNADLIGYALACMETRSWVPAMRR